MVYPYFRMKEEFFYILNERKINMLKQTLLAFTILGVAGTAAAADITNPFFLPESMHVNSITSFDYTHGHVKQAGTSERLYNKTLTEQLQFGILNNLALIGQIDKEWNRSSFDGKSHNALDWEAGLAWNILSCNTKLQLSSVYGQEAPGRTKGTYKYFDTELKLGYQFKTFLPYISGSVVTPVAQTSRDNRWAYNTKIGLYQGACGVWSLDTGLVLGFDRADHRRTLTAEAEASYYLASNVTLGVYGSYMLNGKKEQRTDLYNKSVGARLRLYF